MEQETDNKLEFVEVEVKFRVEESLLVDWKLLCSKLGDQDGFKYKEFIQVDSDDIYFTKPKAKDYEFIRYRFSDDKKNKRAELTIKQKMTEGNNIFRKEKNLRIDNNSKKLVTGFVEDLGYEHNFTITKYVQIYVFDDATLPFYTVIDESGKKKTFMEIEVNEEMIENLTMEECWDIIKKYETALAPLGITPQKRLRLSLFEMYKKG